MAHRCRQAWARPARWAGCRCLRVSRDDTTAMEEGSALASQPGPPHHPPSNALLNGMPMSKPLTGRRSSRFVVRYGFRHAVMPRPPSAG